MSIGMSSGSGIWTNLQRAEAELERHQVSATARAAVYVGMAGVQALFDVGAGLRAIATQQERLVDMEHRKWRPS